MRLNACCVTGPVSGNNQRLVSIGGKLAYAHLVALVFNGLGLVAPSLFRPFQPESLALVLATFVKFYWLQQIMSCLVHAYLAYAAISIYTLLGPLFFIVSVPYLAAIKELR